MHDSYEADHHIKNFFTVPLVHSLHFHFPAGEKKKTYEEYDPIRNYRKESYKCDCRDFTKYVIIMF